MELLENPVATCVYIGFSDVWCPEKGARKKEYYAFPRWIVGQADAERSVGSSSQAEDYLINNKLATILR
jgi:hypothetical protein